VISASRRKARIRGFGRVLISDSQAKTMERFSLGSRGRGVILVPEWPGDRAGQASFEKCRAAQTVPDIIFSMHLAQTISNPVSMQSRLWSPCRQILR
jgi:hypothetical protein